jgi:dolichol-phosphate mannosyltransferase
MSDDQPPRRHRILAVIPAFNEEGKIGRVVGKIPAGVVDAVVVVDDASSDGTAAEAERAGASVLRHESNRGVGAAIRTGIDYARRNAFQFVTVLSGDDQHDPSELPGVLDPLLTGRADFVQGSRQLGGTVDINTFRRVTTTLYTGLFRILTGFACTDATNGFRAFATSIFDDGRIDLWQDWLSTYELEPYLLFKAVRTGRRVLEVPVTVIYHARGTTKMKPIRDWWRILRPLVYLSLGLRR